MWRIYYLYELATNYSSQIYVELFAATVFQYVLSNFSPQN